MRFASHVAKIELLKIFDTEQVVQNLFLGTYIVTKRLTLT